MVIRRMVVWLIILALMLLLTLLILYNGCRTYSAVGRLIRDAPTVLAENTVVSDVQRNDQGTMPATQDEADDSSGAEFSFWGAVPLYDVRPVDGGSLFSLLYEQSLPICRVSDGSPFALPTTGDASSLSRHMEDLLWYQWLQAPVRYLETLLGAFAGSLPFDPED